MMNGKQIFTAHKTTVTRTHKRENVLERVEEDSKPETPPTI